MTSNPRAENYVVLNYNQESSESEQFNPEVPPETRGALTIVRYQDLNAATETASGGTNTISKTVQLDSDNLLAAVGQNDDGQPEWQRLLTAQGKQVIDGNLTVEGIVQIPEGSIEVTHVATDADAVARPSIIVGDEYRVFSAVWNTSTAESVTTVGNATGDQSNLVVWGNVTQYVKSGEANAFRIENTSLGGDPMINVSTSADTTTLYKTVKVDGTFETLGDTTIGSDSADALTVKATTTFNNDVTVGADATDTLTVRSTAAFNNDLTIGSSSADTLTVNAVSTFTNNLSVNGNTTLGNASTDTLTINGTISAADHRIVELYASSDTVGSTIDTTAAQTLFTNHQWNVPANTITRGSAARLRAWGSYGVTGTPTLTIRLKCAAAGSLVAGSTTLLNFGAATLSAAGIWILDATMRYGSSGSTTSQYWTGTLFLGANSGAAVATRMAVDATDLSLSSNRDFGITAQWSASSASNTITFDRYVFETSSI